MGHWEHFKTRILAQMRKLSIRRLFLALFCLILLTAPTILAIHYRNNTNTTSNVDVFAGSLYTEDGQEFAYEIGEPQSAPMDSLLWIFYQIPLEMRQIEAPPGDLADDPHIRAVTTLNGYVSEYTYYFSMIASACYCTDSTGAVYSIPASLSETFLGTSYAEPFYPSAKIPQLITIDRDTILPTQVQWSYKNYHNVMRPAQQYSSAQTTETYEMTGALGMTFSIDPDFCEAKIYNDNTLLYSGSLQQISTLTVDSGKEMTVSVRAIWTKENHPEAYGEIQYEFPVRIRNQSEFSLSTDTIPAGGFTVLSCTNITNPAKIDYSSDIPHSAPAFHQDGDVMRALVIIPQTATVGTHSITITYGASTQTFSLQVTPPAEPLSFSYPSIRLKDPLAALDSAKAEWNALLRKLPQPQSTVYFQGNFVSPVEYGFRIGYTHHSKVQWTNDIISSVIGCEFVTDQKNGDAVRAVQSGTVVQTGSCSLLGNYVLVDHGCGLRLWYGHLSDFDVESGDIIRQGQSLGKTGTGGASTGNGFLLVCTIYNEVVDPSLILGNSIL